MSVRLEQLVGERALAHAHAVLASSGPIAMLGLDEKAVARLVTPSLWAIAKAWAPALGGLVLAGPTGIGKTLGAVWMLRRAIEAIAMQHARVLANQGARPSRVTDELRASLRGFAWVRAVDLAHARSRHALGAGEAPLAAECAAARHLLVLDDLGWEDEAKSATPIPDVVAARYDAGYPTIVTTGLKPPELAKRYGDALVRRIVQAGGKRGQTVAVFGKTKE